MRTHGRRGGRTSSLGWTCILARLTVPEHPINPIEPGVIEPFEDLGVRPMEDFDAMAGPQGYLLDRQTLSGPELTTQEQTELLASMTFAVMVWLHLMTLQYRALSDEVARFDATIGVGMAVFGVLYALLIKRK
jgi:hypothetical protein